MTQKTVVKKTWKAWTTVDDQRLTSFYKAGVPLAQIATILDRSRDSVQQRASQKRLGLAVRSRYTRWSPAERARLLSLSAQRIPRYRIALLLNAEFGTGRSLPVIDRALYRFRRRDTP